MAVLPDSVKTAMTASVKVTELLQHGYLQGLKACFEI
ncbi:hypothetical protein SAMN05216175_104190 [Neptunomonas qingdaonensis]|uniref:Uncharacterized protein n=1 Tax=Neptunomonas qingdaonensis TaxID=1045558 RepID=A0A1I2Q280_9GAMM|nr:hypothetical protein SAMN05216175_104190 [Neptunomonas qingdaonensis]